MEEVVVFWFRRDLRLFDNHGLFQALSSGKKVLPLFIFDTDILANLDKNDARVSFIYFHLKNIHNQLKDCGSSLLIKHGKPIDCWKELLQSFHISAVYCNADYEPSAIQRDNYIFELLSANGIRFEKYKDQVIFEKNEIIKDDGSPYVVYTPYSKKWKQQWNHSRLPFFDSEAHKNAFVKQTFDFPTIESIGFRYQKSAELSFTWNASQIQSYELNRDFPALDACSRVGVHLRFGTVSIRDLVQKASVISEKFLNELIWREFYMQILWHFPRVIQESFVPIYDSIPWNRDEKMFEAWKKGETGIPMVDAGMRELAQTGYMHNRVRMVTASFLTKHLMIDWRWGEAWFAEKLLDFELSSNNGSWQWCAGCGVDAAPYFRVFNPILQQKKFDPDEKYVKKWIPTYKTPDYPKPIIDLESARDKYLTVVKETIKKGERHKAGF